MRLCIVGDLHFRYELPYASAFEDGRRGEWEAVKKKIIETASTCDAVVLLGDNLNSKHNHSSVIKEFIEFLNSFGDKEVHILRGNHELYGSSSALDFLKQLKHKNWHVYTEPVIAKVCGEEAMMIPYMTPALMGVETKEEGIKAIVDKFPNYALAFAFGHHAVSGSRMAGMPVDMLNEIVLPQKEMEKHFSHTFCGHIHQKQNIFPNIYITGCTPSQEVGDHHKSIFVYESDGTIDVKVEEVPLPVRGIYKFEFNRDVDDRNILNIPDHSIVKAIVTDSQLDVEKIKANALSRFDAYVLIEQYPSERQKMSFESGVIDLSVEGLLKLYAEAKGLSYSELQEGFELIRQ